MADGQPTRPTQKSQLACFGGNFPRDNIITLGDIYLSWSAQIKYLGCCFRGEQCAVDPSSFIGRFYGSLNNILNVVGNSRNTIRYDTRCYFNVRSKADISQLNLPHGTDN